VQPDRIVKLLNMLASDYDAEKVNAARVLATAAAEKKMTVSEFIKVGLIGEKPKEPWPTVSAPAPPTKPNAREAVERLGQIIIDNPDVLTDWEYQFVRDVYKRKVSYFTEKQWRIVNRILAKA
jgi:hypothetical protein